MARKKPVFFTEAEERNARLYLKAEPKRMGNLHERMKCAKKLAVDGKIWSHGFGELYQAIWELEDEVEYLTPPNPTFGSRFHKGGGDGEEK